MKEEMLEFVWDMVIDGSLLCAGDEARVEAGCKRVLEGWIADMSKSKEMALRRSKGQTEMGKAFRERVSVE